METIKFLNQKIQERFSSNATVKELEKKIRNQVERKTTKLYSNKTLVRDNLEFELIGVESQFWSDSTSISCDSEIEIELVFICKSQLPKEKRKRVLEVQKKYKETNVLEWNTFKIPLWHKLIYTLEVEKALSGEIYLDIS